MDFNGGDPNPARERCVGVGGRIFPYQDKLPCHGAEGGGKELGREGGKDEDGCMPRHVGFSIRGYRPSLPSHHDYGPRS